MNEITLTTARLHLRRLTAADAIGLFAYRSMPEISAFQTFQPATIADAAAFIAGTAETPDVIGGWYQLGLFLGERLIGDIGIHFVTATEVEMGYSVDPAFQKRGLATEAVSAVVDYLLQVIGKERITFTIDRRNTPSLRLAEGLGFRRTEDGNGGPTADIVYEMKAPDWAAAWTRAR